MVVGREFFLVVTDECTPPPGVSLKADEQAWYRGIKKIAEAKGKQVAFASSGAGAKILVLGTEYHLRVYDTDNQHFRYIYVRLKYKANNQTVGKIKIGIKNRNYFKTLDQFPV